MLLFRLTGYVLAVAGFIVLIVDGMQSVATGRLTMTSLEETLLAVSPDSVGLLRQAVEHALAPVIEAPVAQTMLEIPAFPLALALAFAAVLVSISLGAMVRRIRL